MYINTNMNQITIVSTRENTFKFINEFNQSDKSFYTINVKIEENLYTDGKSYYDISYKYKFEGDEKSKKTIHPFYNGKNLEDNTSGVIIYKNKLTEIMVEYLLLNNKELEKVSGISTSQCYRTNIMLSLSKFWD